MQILRAESLRRRNTLALESRASALVEAQTSTDVAEALAWASAESVPVIPLGEGSNLVLAGDLEGLVLLQCSQEMQLLAQRGESVDIRVSAGHNWHALVRRTLEAGYFGLENLALIPGTVGAAPIQNIGAYGVELDRFVRRVHALDIATGGELSLEADECDFAYRDSIFKRELRDQVIITAVDLRLSRTPQVEYGYPALRAELDHLGIDKPQPEDVFRAVVDVRRRRLPDPAIEPNAGSFFKNPIVDEAVAQSLLTQHAAMPAYAQADGRIKLSAAWLIDQSGWKGQRRGGVGVHPGHALVLVNYGSDSGAELLALADGIVTSVEQQFGVVLEMEPRVYGQSSD